LITDINTEHNSKKMEKLKGHKQQNLVKDE